MRLVVQAFTEAHPAQGVLREPASLATRQAAVEQAVRDRVESRYARRAASAGPYGCV
ncbi:hypothetical protein GCM10012286_35550 [Streptomyces lasiicapitis]|uniref:Uncharacterized protein n=1 Tax=Streptomyces lasiicapitis TaxID=1923961 RepID=A0ABQ2M2B8_9ACTN|nr:hypothetical protein GCM10012286_35550 [Streptomyces lasiicapitis]